VVGLAAPGPDRARVRPVQPGPEHGRAAVVDGGRHQVLVRRLPAGPCPRRQPAPRGRARLGAQARRGRRMTYLPYVIGAYAVFAVVLLWDFLAPRLQLRRELRAARLRAARARKPAATAG